MQVHHFSTRLGGRMELDICFACQGLWFDRNENLQLASASVVDLFKLLHEHRIDEHNSIAKQMACPRCKGGLQQGFDVVRSGRYMTYRCTAQHGRFSTFAAFMVEKGFARQLSPAEVKELGARIQAIHCNSCGAAVDIRKDAACPYCRTAFSLLDPQAVAQALQEHSRRAGPISTNAPQGHITVEAVADAMMDLERERRNAARTAHQLWSRPASGSNDLMGDLLGAGIVLVWKMLSS
jgi:hypothetical protein